MKRFLLFALTIVLSISGNGQQFAPIGSEWYNEALRGIFHIRVAKDTVIDNIAARVITYTPHIIDPWASLGFRLNTPQPKYVYSTEDTVFIYNTLFKKFTPLYVFNVSDGDTVTLPLITPNNGCASFTGSLGDSIYSFVVDSVRAVLYDTAYLQTFYTHGLALPGRQRMSFPVYARVLGGLQTGLLPDCDSCMMLTSDNCAGPASVRCYYSSSYAIKLVNDDCAKGIKVSVDDIYKQGIAISLYPNPASKQVTLQFSKPFVKQVRCVLLDVTGHEIFAAAVAPSASSVTYDVSGVSPGQYNLLLLDGKGVLFKRKLAIIR